MQKWKKISWVLGAASAKCQYVSRVYKKKSLPLPAGAHHGKIGQRWEVLWIKLKADRPRLRYNFHRPFDCRHTVLWLVIRVIPCPKLESAHKQMDRRTLPILLSPCFVADKSNFWNILSHLCQPVYNDKSILYGDSQRQNEFHNSRWWSFMKTPPAEKNLCFLTIIVQDEKECIITYVSCACH